MQQSLWVLDASSSHSVIVTFGAFPYAICAAGSHPLHRPSSRLAALGAISGCARLPGVCRPFDVFNNCSDPHPRRLAPSLLSYRSLPVRLCCVLGCSQPLDALFRSCPPALFRAGSVLGLRSFEGLSPNPSPGSLSARSVLRVVTALARGRLRGFRQWLDACHRVA